MGHGAITHGEAGHGNRSTEWKTWRHIIDRCGNPKKRYYINTKGYEPGNVRWATWKEQARNRNGNTRLTHNGETKTLAEWAESVGMAFHTLHARLSRRRGDGGITLGEALSKPLRRALPKKCKHCGTEDPKRFKKERATECGACEKRMRDNGPCPVCGKPIRIGTGKRVPHCECGWRAGPDDWTKARPKDSHGRFTW